MMISIPPSDKIETLIREITAAEIMPRFQTLSHDEKWEKKINVLSKLNKTWLISNSIQSFPSTNQVFQGETSMLSIFFFSERFQGYRLILR